MLCQACGRNAETRYVSYSQNIGMLVIRSSKSIKGNMCPDCAGKYFLEYTLTTLFLGWWGVISFIMTPFILIWNIVSYCSRKNVQPVSYDTNPEMSSQGYDPMFYGYGSPSQGYTPPPQDHASSQQGGAAPLSEAAASSQENGSQSRAEDTPTEGNRPAPKDDPARIDKAQSSDAPHHWDL